MRRPIRTAIGCATKRRRIRRRARSKLRSRIYSNPTPGVAINYVLDGYKIIYQLIAAGRNPIVVMPVQPSSDWGPWASQGGIGRSIREVVRFLFAKRYVATKPLTFSQLRLSPAGTGEFPPEKPLSNDTLPDDTQLRITVSGFSAGVSAIITLCSGVPDKLRQELPQNYPAPLFFAPDTFMNDRWVELWDIDCSIQKVMSWDQGIQSWKAWKGRSSKRRIRAYHSQDTSPLGSQNGLVEAKLVVRKMGKAGFVELGESPDKSITWVGFSDSYLIGNKTSPNHVKVKPEFGTLDPHHFVPTIAFAHAAQYAVPT